MAITATLVFMAKKVFTRVFSVRLTSLEWKILSELVNGVNGETLSEKFREWLRLHGSLKPQGEGKHTHTRVNIVDEAENRKEAKNEFEAIKERTNELLTILRNAKF